jgi:beta-1,4-N-acetylglucosaminyltransferase
MEKKVSKLRICIVCSAGGHFAEVLKATKNIRDDKYYITYRTAVTEDFARINKVYFITHPRHCFFLLRMLLFFINIIESLRVLINERPDVVISTGADVAVPTCILAKLFGKKLIYIESGGYVYSRSLSGRIVYPLADLFIVQWKPALKNFPGAVYGGPLF